MSTNERKARREAAKEAFLTELRLRPNGSLVERKIKRYRFDGDVLTGIEFYATIEEPSEPVGAGETTPPNA